MPPWIYKRKKKTAVKPRPTRREKEPFDGEHFFGTVGGFVKDYFDAHYEPSGKEGQPVGFHEGDILEYLKKETRYFDAMQPPKTEDEINDAWRYIGHYFGNELWSRIPDDDRLPTEKPIRHTMTRAQKEKAKRKKKNTMPRSRHFR